MTKTNTYPFDVPGNYTIGTNAEVSGSAARLSDIGGPKSIERLGDAFTPTDSNSEVDSGVLRLVDKKDSDLSFYMSYYNNVSETNYGNGTNAAPITGAGDVTSNKLNLDKGSFTYSLVNPDNFSGILNRGACYIKVIPQFSGFPPTPQQYVQFADSGFANNRLVIQHQQGANNIYVIIFDKNGDRPVDELIPYTAVAGTPVEIFCRWDLVDRTFEFWLDGVKILDQTSIPFSDFDAVIGRYVIGANTTLSPTQVANFKLDEMAIWETDAIDLATAQVLSTYRYSEGSGSAAVNDSGALNTFSGITENTVSGSPRYTVDGKYWNGASWVASDGSYAQSSSAADVTTNGGALTIAAFPFNVVAVFPDSQTVQASLTDIDVNAVTTEYDQTGPTVETVTPAIRTDIIESIVLTKTEPTGTSITMAIVIDGTAYIWNGTAWEASPTGSYDPDDTSIDFSLLSDVLGTGADVALKFFLNGTLTQTPVLSSAVINYDFAKPAYTPVPVCRVYGRLLSCLTDTKTVTVVITQDADFWLNDQFLRATTQELSLDSDGCFEIDLCRSVLATGSPTFTFAYKTVEVVDGDEVEVITTLGTVAIPDQEECDLFDLVGS